MRIDKGYRADIIVDRTVLLELKSVDRVLLKDGSHPFVA